MKTSLSILILGTLLATSAFAQEHKYSCLDPADHDIQDDITFTVISATTVDVAGDKAKLDTTYSPRLNDGFSRFEYLQSDEGVSEVLVQDKLLKGARIGFIKLQNRGEGFSTQKLRCTEL